MSYQIRKAVNNALNEALKEGIGRAIKYAAKEAIHEVLEESVGNFLDEDTVRIYCNDIFRDIRQGVNSMMEQVFDEPVDKEDMVND